MELMMLIYLDQKGRNVQRPLSFEEVKTARDGPI
jgi:hypothetical protein